MMQGEAKPFEITILAGDTRDPFELRAGLIFDKAGPTRAEPPVTPWEEVGMGQGEAKPFEITILAGDTRDPLDLRQEMRYVKAALFYAGRVRLVSPKVGLLAALEDTPELYDTPEGIDLRECLAGIRPLNLAPPSGWATMSHNSYAMAPTIYRAGDHDALPMLRRVAAALRDSHAIAEMSRACNANVLKVEGGGGTQMVVFDETKPARAGDATADRRTSALGSADRSRNACRVIPPSTRHHR